MTISELANVAQVSQRTVRRVVAEKFPGKMQDGKKTVFSRHEATVIMGEIRKPGFVSPDVPRQNAEVPRQNAQLPNGTQLEALRKIYGPAEAAKRLDFIIGYRNLFAPAYKQAEFALPAPKPARPSILRQAYPIRDTHAVAIIVGKEPAWVEIKARQYDIKIGDYYLEDLYVLWCVANGYAIRPLHGPADRRVAVIEEHVRDIERRERVGA